MQCKTAKQPGVGMDGSIACRYVGAKTLTGAVIRLTDSNVLSYAAIPSC